MTEFVGKVLLLLSLSLIPALPNSCPHGADGSLPRRCQRAADDAAAGHCHVAVRLSAGSPWAHLSVKRSASSRLAGATIDSPVPLTSIAARFPRSSPYADDAAAAEPTTRWILVPSTRDLIGASPVLPQAPFDAVATPFQPLRKLKNVAKRLRSSLYSGETTTTPSSKALFHGIHIAYFPLLYRCRLSRTPPCSRSRAV